MKSAIVATMILLSSFVRAENIVGAKITTIMVDKAHPGMIFIRLDKARTTGVPSCHTSTWSYVMSYSDDMDKAMYSALLAADAAQKSLNFYGTSACDVRPDAETLQRIELE